MRKLLPLVLLGFALFALGAETANGAEPRVFDITAREWTFDISPSPFTVNAGDTVTLNIVSVDSTHGFYLERYAEEARTFRRGERITVTFVANTPGTFTFLCTNFCGIGHGNMTGMFTVIGQQGPAPTLTSFSPTNGPVSGGNNVVINGTNFQNGVTVKFGSVDAVAVNYISNTSLVAVAPAQAQGTVAITVTNPDGQSATRAGYGYGVVPVAPSINSISPSSVSTGGGSRVTIRGANFQSGATVTFGGLAARDVTFIDATSIDATAPIGPHNLAASSAIDVVVTNPDGLAATRRGEVLWTIPLPTITAVAPSAGALSGGTVVTISGFGFTNALPISVLFGGVTAADVTVIDAVTLRVVAPPHAAGLVDVAVTVGGQNATVANAFTYANGKPRRRASQH